MEKQEIIEELGKILSHSCILIKRGYIFQASSEGNVRKIMRKTKKADGYEIITISEKSISKQFFVHRLVAAAFLGLDIFDKKTFTCHKDDNPTNNKLENLFIGNANDNVQDMIQKGRQVVWSKLTDENVIEIRKKRSDGFSISKLAKEFNVHKSTISRICNGITW